MHSNEIYIRIKSLLLSFRDNVDADNDVRNCRDYLWITVSIWKVHS